MLQFATKWVTGIFVPHSYSKIHEERTKSGFWPDFTDIFKVSKKFFLGFVTFLFTLLSLNTISRTIVSIQQNIFYIFLSDINSHKCDFDILEWLYCFANDFPLLIIKDWASINSSFKNAVFKSGNFGMNEHRLFTPILRNAGY